MKKEVKDAMTLILILVVMWFLYSKVIEKYTEDSAEAASVKLDILKFFNETKEPYYHNYVDIFINAGLTGSVLMTQKYYKKFLELHKQHKLTEQAIH
jgi:uncharacterized membrane protein